MPDPSKNQCKKRRAFRYHIFRILVSIWRGFGLQNASQNHTLGTKMLGRSSFWAVLAAVFPQNGVSEGPEVDFGALRSRFGSLWGQWFWYFASFLSMFVSTFCIIWTNFPHEFLAACMDFQCPLAPQSLFSNIHLPRAPASSRPRRDSRSVNNFGNAQVCAAQRVVSDKSLLPIN